MLKTICINLTQPHHGGCARSLPQDRRKGSENLTQSLNHRSTLLLIASNHCKNIFLYQMSQNNGFTFCPYSFSYVQK